MKQISLIICTICLCIGCEEIFHPEETTIGIIESPEELESAVNGVYGELAKSFTHLYEDNGFFIVNEKGDDLSSKMANYSVFYRGSSYCGTMDNGEVVHNAWNRLYSVITSANNIIVQYNPAIIQDKSIAKLLGEAYLLRAYSYFRLTRTYGQVPLVDDIEISYTLPKASFREIYEFIEADLKMAMSLLPANNNEARIPYITPHRGVAKAILAEVYLSWAGYPVKDALKYTLAASLAKEVIDSAAYFGMGLVSDFANLWDSDHYYNCESVFILYFADPRYTTILDEINTAYSGHVIEFGDLKIHPDSSGLYIFFPPAEINFYNSYPAGYRKEITFFSTIYVPNEYPYYPEIDTGYVHIQFVDECSRIAYRKFYYNYYSIPFSQFYNTSTTLEFLLGNNKIYLFRYAQTLLTYAEAKVRSGQLDALAYEAVNRIRRRANNVDQYSVSAYDLTPGLSTEAFADSVVWERAWELAGEPEGRWFDLVRLELVENLPQWRHPQEGGPPFAPITKEDYFSPIPEEDQLLNPNLGEE